MWSLLLLAVLSAASTKPVEESVEVNALKQLPLTSKYHFTLQTDVALGDETSLVKHVCAPAPPCVIPCPVRVPVGVPCPVPQPVPVRIPQPVPVPVPQPVPVICAPVPIPEPCPIPVPEPVPVPVVEPVPAPVPVPVPVLVRPPCCCPCPCGVPIPAKPIKDNSSNDSRSHNGPSPPLCQTEKERQRKVT
ncbi:hypothetical protein Q1695_005907 [Nippostrongylus brasiliensis]|nr:hypothetical protein Q1695_005907 [Nippostrongylus brasiliensis]